MTKKRVVKGWMLKGRYDGFHSFFKSRHEAQQWANEDEYIERCVITYTVPKKGKKA